MSVSYFTVFFTRRVGHVDSDVYRNSSVLIWTMA